jgi:shikimate kinase
MRIYLVGFMGCGKSTVGKRLAAYCGFLFVDTDGLFEEKHRCSIAVFLHSHTEELFRKEETALLHQTQQMEDVVVAVGGGMPCFHGNMQWMLSRGIVVYLNMSPDALYNRLLFSKKERPLLPDSEEERRTTIQNLLSEREPVYRQAHTTVEGINLKVADLRRTLYEL